MKTIAWDVDDVLNDLMQSWFEQKWLKDHPDCNIRYDEITENPPHKLLGGSIDEYLLSLDRFRLSPLYQEMNPVNEVMEWFSKYGGNFHHIALTATPLIAVSASAQWVFRHFGRWIRTFHFVPSKRQEQVIPEYESDKGDFLQWIFRVDVLVDDGESNIMSAEKVGCKGILIPRPWNKSKISIGETLSMLTDIL
ncbi:MAG: hypothetical protein HY761_07070 [Candidatus Omnitrophica bacterium]|nr:hypothetical protein [Candidatus Omnitrophota bacterium]